MPTIKTADKETRPTTLHLPVRLDDMLDDMKERLGISRTALICRGIELVRHEFKPILKLREAPINDP